MRLLPVFLEPPRLASSLSPSASLLFFLFSFFCSRFLRFVAFALALPRIFLIAPCEREASDVPLLSLRFFFLPIDNAESQL